MATPNELIREKGFWDGGAPAHSSNKESSGRPSGFPGVRKLPRLGVATDIEFPPEELVDEKLTKS